MYRLFLFVVLVCISQLSFSQKKDKAKQKNADQTVMTNLQAHIGYLADDKLEWFSSIDGFLGTGATLSVKLQGGACSVFTHVITLKVTNSGGIQASHSITILVGQIC